MTPLPPPDAALLDGSDWQAVFGGWVDPVRPRSVSSGTAPPLRRTAGLTDREHEVLRWVAAGKTDRDIGAILGISFRTVHKHLQAAYAKLGVETRTAAVMRLMTNA